MKRTWLTVLVVLIFLGLLALVFGLAVWSQRPAEIARQSVLELDLTKAYPEYLPYQGLTGSFLEVVPTLRSVVKALERAAEDDRVVGIVARVGTAPMGLASAQELRDAVLRFRESGKPAFAYADTFGEWQAGNVAFYLASGFERIYLQPSGDVCLTGFLYETPFYLGLLEKLDVVPRLGQRYEYKNAANVYTETGFTEPHREALQTLADSQFDQIVEGIAEARGLSPAEVRALSARSPLLGAEAVAAGLVDELVYRDGVYAALEGRFDEEPEYVRLKRYARTDLPSGWSVAAPWGTKVALIYGVGAVTRGESGYDPLFGSQNMGSETVAEAFRQAIEDDEVRAILFRINSPGGSYVASDSIWRETVRARDAGKPVIVSMGDVAASGGYFVAMAADSIVAQPGTITGSIGVFGGKLVTRGLWNKAGITFDDVVTSRRARIWSPNHDFDDGDWSRIEASLDRIYLDFTGKVAEARELSPEAIHEVARGRVWTGADAVEHGLVDEVGGYPVALRRVREAIGADRDEELTLQLFPHPKSPFELFREGRFLGAGAELETVRSLAARLRPILIAARELGLLEGGEPAPLDLPAPVLRPVETP